MLDTRVKLCRRFIVESEQSWVLYGHGTCVVLPNPVDDLIEQASDLLKEFGPVHAGSSYGDFATHKLDDGLGWFVLSHHPDILTIVTPKDLGNRTTDDIGIGLLGRSSRNIDAHELEVVHVEDKRKPS